MSHAGDGASFESGSDQEELRHGPGESMGCSCDESSDFRHHFDDVSMLGEAESRCCLPIQPRNDQTSASDSTDASLTRWENSDSAGLPFVVQHGRSLFFLTWESNRWTLAELEFDAPSCTFVEQRRTHYEWPREAFGVLLSRFTLIERVETSLLKRTSDDFARWLGSQFQVFTHSR